MKKAPAARRLPGLTLGRINTENEMNCKVSP